MASRDCGNSVQNWFLPVHYYIGENGHYGDIGPDGQPQYCEYSDKINHGNSRFSISLQAVPALSQLVCEARVGIGISRMPEV